MNSLYLSRLSKPKTTSFATSFIKKFFFCDIVSTHSWRRSFAVAACCPGGVAKKAKDANKQSLFGATSFRTSIFLCNSEGAEVELVIGSMRL